MQLRGVVAVSLVVAAAGCAREDKPAASRVPAASAPASKPPGVPPEIDGKTPLPSPLPEVAARVNGEVIPLRNVTMMARKALAERGGDTTQEPLVYRQALNQFIVRELLFQEAVSRHLKADDKQLEEAYNQARVNYKSDSDWAAYLASQGMTPAIFRSELRIMRTVGALISEESGKIRDVSDFELQAFYNANPRMFDTGERVSASHILLLVPQGMDADRKAELRTRAEGLLARARTGEDFAKLARESSEDTASAGQGGKLPPFARGQMVPPFEAATFSLKPGQVSNVVETTYGFHIIKLHERLPAQKIPLEAVREELRQRVLHEKQQDALQALVNSLRAKAKIETYL